MSRIDIDEQQKYLTYILYIYRIIYIIYYRCGDAFTKQISVYYNAYNFLFFFSFSAWIGSRHIVTFMLFLGMANAYIMRTNMSVAIVAMVNQTALERDPTIPDDECEGYYTPAANSTVHVSIIYHDRGMHRLGTIYTGPRISKY